MTVNLRVGALAAAAGALAVAMPAAAQPGPFTHHGRAGRAPDSRRCLPHDVAYLESGTVDANAVSTLARNPDGRWSGTLVVDVIRANHRAQQDVGTTVTYTVTNADLRVRFHRGLSGFGPGDRVRLLGTLEVVGRQCPAPSPAPTPVLRVVSVRPPAPGTVPPPVPVSPPVPT